MRDLSVIIPARNEMFLHETVKNVLDNIRADTEVIVIADGYKPDLPVNDTRLRVIELAESIGQRAATNLGARTSEATYIMKLDAHCAVDAGFDTKLIEDCQPDWTMVPAMYNLHAFDWECLRCGSRTYQGSKPKQCEKCKADELKMAVVWKPRTNRLTVSWRFDKTLQFQYWRNHSKRPEAKGDFIETMSFIGACMFLRRDRFWELGGMDENHGSWGQFGTEWACKSWLSGGKLITTRKTWFAHMFRTGNFAANGESTWPYPISQQQIDNARAYSRDLWLNDKWPMAKHKLQWLVDKFHPVPGWEN